MVGKGMRISDEEEAFLRTLYDQGVNKRQGALKTGLAEATVYRYYTKWNALKNAKLLDLEHLGPQRFRELDIQARMRGMSVYNLSIQLLNVIIADNLFNSILDIDENNPQKKRLVKDADS